MKNYMTPQELDAENRAILRENAAAERAEWAQARFDTLLIAAKKDGKDMPDMSRDYWGSALISAEYDGILQGPPEDMPTCEARVLTAKLVRLLDMRPVTE